MATIPKNYHPTTTAQIFHQFANYARTKMKDSSSFVISVECGGITESWLAHWISTEALAFCVNKTTFNLLSLKNRNVVFTPLVKIEPDFNEKIPELYGCYDP